jgi:hypothetical protein
MIQFQSNTSLFGANNVEAAKAQQQTNQIGSSSFDGELSQAIASALEQLGINPNQVNISITPNTASSPAATSTPQASTSSPAVSTTAASAETTLPAVSTASTASTDPTSSATTQQSFDEQYWANQPTAIQQLQNISDPTERSMMAGQLAAEGYQIDAPIMAWGWDPSSTMALRQEFGYTWVPSGFQNPIQEAPGMQVPGLTPYDPNNPPAGSIAVS